MRSWFIPAVIAILALISLVTLKSVAEAFANNQALFFVLGAGVYLLASRFSYRFLEQIHWLGYATVCVFLIITLLVGNVTRGSARWIDLGFFRFQPSQLAIPVIGLSASLFVANNSMKKPLNLVGFLTLIGAPGVLILIEPDLGSTLVYIFSVGSILLISDLPWKYILGLGVAALILSIISWDFILKPYQKQRIFSFMEPNGESQASYNAHQALIAVGSGGVWGRGVGQGVQSHLRFLPERQTDFIFASYAEEWGYIGTVALLLVYTSLIIYLLYLAGRVGYAPAQYYICITMAMLLIQATINIGMNIGILPITGVTLPLVSYGGSSILSICAMLGLVSSIGRKELHQPAHHVI